jgi:hypothetical protein
VRRNALWGAGIGRGELSQRRLCLDAADSGGTLVMRSGGARVDCRPATQIEQAAGLVMGLGIAGCGGFLVQRQGQSVILRHAPPLLVQPGQRGMGGLIAGLGCRPIPLRRLGIVLPSAEPLLVEATQTVLGQGHVQMRPVAIGEQGEPVVAALLGLDAWLHDRDLRLGRLRGRRVGC